MAERSVRAVVAMVVLPMLLVAACTNATDAAPVPDGFRDVKANRLQLVVPEDWVEAEPTGAYDVALQDGTGDDFSIRLLASSDYPDDSARGAIDQIQTFSGIASDEPGGVAEIPRDDGRAMWSWDITYDDGDYHLVVWALQDDRLDTVAIVSVTGRDELPTELVETIRDSIDVS